MKHFTDLWNLIGGHRLPSEDDGPARRTQIIIVATFASAACMTPATSFSTLRCSRRAMRN